jgi:hypothetical protein
VAWLRCSLLLALLASVAAAQSPDIPALTWAERSDWTNVRTDVNPPAVGDGIADDTRAIQAALDTRTVRTAVYLPAGIYRITDTLTLTGSTEGALVTGDGRSTRIVWDGPAGGRMFRSDGVAYSRYIGLSWDGQGRAAVGFDHDAALRYETEVRHQYEAYRNMTESGIRVGHAQQIASAEILYRDCLFENCGTGLSFLQFNDYDNTIDGCEFRDCGVGVRDAKGNFYLRDSHFERSREADVAMDSEHGSSIRRCTSVGSRCFAVMASAIAPLTIEDCHVRAWTAPDGAVHLSGSPVLVMDSTFEDPPSDAPPIARASEGQRLFVSQCVPEQLERLVQPAGGPFVYRIPAGKRPAAVTDPARSFLCQSVPPEGPVFDAVRDFGAKADGVADDTAAIQAAIDAARDAANGAVAYLPAGRYRIARSLAVTGEGYTVEGGGWRCALVWAGEPGQPIIDVRGVRDVRLASLMVGHGDLGPMVHGADVLVHSPDGAPCRLTLDEVYGYGLYKTDPDLHGIQFVGLPAGSVVHAVHVQGNLRVTDCSDAAILVRTSYEGTVTVEGARPPGAEGFLGVLMRLGTLCRPTLHVRDNQSIVMGDFYNEQTSQHLLIEGQPGQPEGAVTIQGAKMHTLTQDPAIEVNGYAGRIYYGQSQFYVEPKEPRFVSTGEARAHLILAGHFWYNTAPRFELAPSTRLTLIGNRGTPDDAVADVGVDGSALEAMAGVLDDLRRLGETDLATREMGRR